jgi:hypothetical protein
MIKKLAQTIPVSLMAGVTKETFKGEGFLLYAEIIISTPIDQLFARWYTGGIKRSFSSN